jgi:hypothetical protein
MFPLWSGVLPPRASRSKTLKRAQGKTIKILPSKFLAVALLLITMSVGKTVWAQEYSPHTKAGLIANPEAGKTLELKDGRTLTYRQLVESSEIEREKMLELVTKRSARSNFHEWVAATINAEAEETKRRTNGLIEEAEETKRRTNGLIEEFAIKLRLLASTRSAQGKRLTKDYYDVVREYVDQKKFELKPETIRYFESLLANPDAFEK